LDDDWVALWIGKPLDLNLRAADKANVANFRMAKPDMGCGGEMPRLKAGFSGFLMVI